LPHVPGASAIHFKGAIMAEPHVEIRTVRDDLSKNSGDAVVKAELEARWLDSHPNGTEGEYIDYRVADFDGWQSTLDTLRSSYDLSIRRQKDEDLRMSEAVRVDRNRLQLKDERDFLVGTESQRAYSNLQDTFRDDVLYGVTSEGFYKLEAKDMAEFRKLLGDAKAGAQRNATQLAAELGAAIASSMGFDERARRKDTDLYLHLEDLKDALKGWDTLLASAALPDKTALTRQAKECANTFERCFKAHGEAFSTETNLLVKYQLLASMRAIAEKVASQFAARAGKPSFAAMSALIGDVPKQAPAGTQAGKELGGDLKTAFTTALVKLEKDLNKVDKNLGAQLKATLTSVPYGVADALVVWADNYKDPGKLTANVKQLREAIATVAFGLRKYKGLVDNALGKSDVAGVRKVRDAYQQTFDSFTGKLQNDLKLCVDTLGS
jgi:hypothetical protein